MITLLIGHRGCGKSSLLKRISVYLPATTTVDLDEWITRTGGRPVADIFTHEGEEAFRRLELKALDQILASNKPPLVVALGAGFTGPLPEGSHCLWVRRDSDPVGRIFMDRPRLEPDVDPLEEYHLRFPIREKRYREWAHEVLTLREGFLGSSLVEKCFFSGGSKDFGGALTLLPENFRNWEEWHCKRLAWGVDLFEIRDDLLTPHQVAQAISFLPENRVLYSFRKGSKPALPEGVLKDWPLELGSCRNFQPDIFSLHERHEGESFSAAKERLTAVEGETRLKLATRVSTFSQLWEGHQWAAENTKKRIFLPVSADGRWAWYRHLMQGRTSLNFFREGTGSAPDQPLLLDWASPPAGATFAAVLGDPVAHSWTPAEHADWGRRRGMSVYAIKVTREEWEAGALEVLRQLGLHCAAVTAPLKDLAFAAAAYVDESAASLGVANTLLWHEANGHWRGTNTDRAGLAHALMVCGGKEEAVVWGGGGTLPVLKSLLPNAGFYAARTGRLRAGREVVEPKLLVWATGRMGASLPRSWRPTWVLDLSYREDSPGRRYALQVGADYISGESMFREQARLQQLFWGA